MGTAVIQSANHQCRRTLCSSGLGIGQRRTVVPRQLGFAAAEHTNDGASVGSRAPEIPTVAEPAPSFARGRGGVIGAFQPKALAAEVSGPSELARYEFWRLVLLPDCPPHLEFSTVGNFANNDVTLRVDRNAMRVREIATLVTRSPEFRENFSRGSVQNMDHVIGAVGDIHELLSGV